jgi:uncharacterized protein (TIGR02118 family)
MAVTLQVLYPVGDDTTFDHAYYATTHMDLVDQHMGAHIASVQASKGLAGGPNVPAPYHAITTITFADQGAMGFAMKEAGPVMADIANFTNIQPQILIGEIYG